MHSEIEQSKPGRCPKCGMKLVLKESSLLDGRTRNTSTSEVEEEFSSTKHGVWRSYTPLIVIIGLILLTALTISYRDLQFGTFALTKTISYFVIGFFLVFSGFKLMDLKGFAEGYSTYDLLAQRWFNYGYIYPFIELFFGLAMILTPDARWLLLLELIVMTFSGLGVAIKLAKREKFQCACLGTFLKVPLTKVTLIEDFGMAALAAIMLFFV